MMTDRLKKKECAPAQLFHGAGQGAGGFDE